MSDIKRRIVAITYQESKEEFFAQRLKTAQRQLDNVVKYGTDHNACAEKGEIVGYYVDAIEALKESAERDKGCDQCQHYVNDFNFCPNCGRKLTKEEST